MLYNFVSWCLWMLLVIGEWIAFVEEQIKAIREKVGDGKVFMCP